MTLPASGAISMGQVNVELGLPFTSSINLGIGPVRGLFGIPSGTIDMNSGHGKSSVNDVNRRISEGTDNVIYNYYDPSGSWTTNPWTVYIGETNRSLTALLRFTNITVPKNSVIDVAYIALRATGSGDSPDFICNTLIYGEASDNAVTYSTLADWNTRYYYNNYVAWNGIPYWIYGTYYNTPSIAPIVQTIVNRSAWVSGHTMAFKIKDNHTNWSDYDAWRRFTSYRDRPDESALLHIEYH
jgi:hypothetical protein